MSISGCGTAQKGITVEDKQITELLEEIEFDTAYIDAKLVTAIEESEDLLKQILAFLGKQQ